MSDKQLLIDQITTAFVKTEYPGDWCIVSSNEGSEPSETAAAFKGKRERYSIDPKLLDNAPKGLSSALSFFSDEAFRFFLPAYMIADIRKELHQVNVLFHLTHGLTDKTCNKAVNPIRYGRRTWLDTQSYKFAMFSKEEAAAIIAYLHFKTKKMNDFNHDNIDQALKNYWNSRTV
jgi:hypothetical protein